MIVQSLKQTIFIIEQEQKDRPVSLNCIADDLDCLKEHMELVIKYLAPSNLEDLEVSLPKTICEIRASHTTEL